MPSREGREPPLKGGSRSRLSFVLRALMPRQLHGKSSKTQGPEACADLSETPHHGLGVRDVPRKAGHHVLLGTICCRALCAAGRCASAQRAPCAACRQPQERARTPRTVLQGQKPSRLLQALKHCQLHLLCWFCCALGAQEFFGCYHKGDLSIWSDAVTRKHLGVSLCCHFTKFVLLLTSHSLVQRLGLEQKLSCYVGSSLTIILLLTVPCNKHNKLFKPGPPIEVKYMN